MLLSPYELEGGEWKHFPPFELLVGRMAALAAEDVYKIYPAQHDEFEFGFGLRKASIINQDDSQAKGTQGSRSSLGLKVCYTCLSIVQIKVYEHSRKDKKGNK